MPPKINLDHKIFVEKLKIYMKKQIIIAGFLAASYITNAQTWGGSTLLGGDAYRTGNVGIGDYASATEKLYVNGTVKFTGQYGIRLFNNGYDTYNSNLYLANSANTKAYNFQLNSSGTSLDFYTYGGGNWTRKFSFTETGLLGIGVPSPQAFLHVSTPVNSTGTGLIVEQLSTTTPAYALISRVKNNSTKAFVVENTISPTVTEEVFKVFGNGKTQIGTQFTQIDNSAKLAVDSKVQIGNALQISNPHFANYLLSVNGKLVCKEVYVTNQSWADFVFDNNYKLRSLREVEKYYRENHHLPEIPTAKEVEENGVSVSEINKLLLQKIEELTIYLVEQQKEIDVLKKKIND